MNSKERVIASLNGQQTDRPMFCPAIYEHKARLIDSSPSQVAQSGDLLVKSILAEYEIYKPDMLTVGIDIYNIEPEAIGCTISFPEEIDAVPSIDKKILADVEEANKLTRVDVEKAGRMPLMLEATERLQKTLGKEVFVRGAISGPYSIAAELLGMEQLMMACITQPNDVNGLLSFCTDVAIGYGKAFLARGVEVCIFDSQTAPPLMSPEIYGKLILPHIQKLIRILKSSGARFVEYVVGGDAAVNVENIFATGADILLSDFAVDQEIFLTRASSEKCFVRRNISPILVEQGDESELIAQTQQVARLAKINPQVIIGTGVLSYNTPVERVLLVKNTCMKEFTS